MTHCLFCSMAAGHIRPHVIFEDDILLAFLDIGPIRPGHTQIVPRQHYAYFDDLPLELASAVLRLGQRVAKAQKLVFGVERVGFQFSGGDIAHAHAHVVPLHDKTDLTSRRYIQEQQLTFQAIAEPPKAELQRIATELARRLASL
jgi:histidine triad (HIT) family protein